MKAALYARVSRADQMTLDEKRALVRWIVRRISKIEELMEGQPLDAQLPNDLYGEESALIKCLAILRPSRCDDGFMRKPQPSEPTLEYRVLKGRKRAQTLSEIEMKRGVKILDRYHFGIYYKDL